jgi:hypothetical protein
MPELFEVLKEYDAVTDTSVACNYRELDSMYPDSKFILTVRDVESWFLSARKEFEGRDVDEPWKNEVRIRLYSSAKWYPQSFLNGYVRHNEAVRHYFQEPPDKLLELDVFKGQGWQPLCAFLGCSIPSMPFPHLTGLSKGMPDCGIRYV